MSGHIFEISPPPHSHVDPADVAFSKRSCCFWVPFTSTSTGPASHSSPSSPPPSWWGRIRTAASGQATSSDQPWWARGWKKVREWSEKLASPKWKTFIRRFGRNRANPCHPGLGAAAGAGQFRYDALSYARNFDEGHSCNNHNFDDGRDLSPRRDFSSRYALISASSKGSMDLGRDRDGPFFT